MLELPEAESVLWLAAEVYRISLAIVFVLELEWFTQIIRWSCLSFIIIITTGVSRQMGAYMERIRQVWEAIERPR